MMAVCRTLIGVTFCMAAALTGCRPRQNVAPADLSSPRASNGPRIETKIGDEIDLAQFEEAQRHRPPLTKPGSPVHDSAAAASHRAEISWHLRHACGTTVHPSVRVDGNVIRLAAPIDGEPTANCSDRIARIYTTITGLTPGRYRIIDGDRFDKLLDVPGE